MQRSRHLLLLFLALLAGLELRAQAQLIEPQVVPARVEDALRFNTTSVLGSARFMGTGGSMTPLGVDFSTIHTNPAGIGWNRSSYAAVSGGVNLLGADATLRGNGNTSSENSIVNPNVPSLGLVWSSGSRTQKWPTLNFAFSLTRLADFNETITYAGSSAGSIIDAVVEDFNTLFDPNFGDTGDAFRSDLIFQIDPTVAQGELPVATDTRPVRLDDLGFYSAFDLDENLGARIDREGQVERSGSMNEFALALGGNYSNKLLWGLSLGIPFVNFEETKTYDEVDARNEVSSYDDASYDETLIMEGSGANFRLGFIYLPSPQSRVSVSVQTPTLWTIDETFFTDLTYNYTVGDEARGGNAQSDFFEGPINLRTPWRYNFGLGYLLGKTGFVTADVNYTNYGGTKFSFDDFATLDEPTNADIDATLTSSIDARIGGEINIDPLQVRAGIGYRTLGTVDTRFNEDEAFLTYSAGLGYNAGKFFIDLAARYEATSGFYAPYRTFAFEPNLVDVDRNRITAVITVGYRGFGQ